MFKKNKERNFTDKLKIKENKKYKRKYNTEANNKVIIWTFFNLSSTLLFNHPIKYPIIKNNKVLIPKIFKYMKSKIAPIKKLQITVSVCPKNKAKKTIYAKNRFGLIKKGRILKNNMSEMIIIIKTIIENNSFLILSMRYLI